MIFENFQFYFSLCLEMDSRMYARHLFCSQLNYLTIVKNSKAEGQDTKRNLEKEHLESQFSCKQYG